MSNIYKQILTKYWGFTVFRSMQEEIISSVGEGQDTLALLPTGGGKSITFQVPAMAKEGICIVISPLIALMKDQVENLKKRNIKAIAVNSVMSKGEIDIALNNCVFGDIKFLYLSPERLSTEMFRARVRDMNVNLIAVDEAHCISQWGYDFRPSYLKIAEIREYLPDVPVLALTATATPEVVEDIQDKLLFRKKNVIRKSFERKNLAYVVKEAEDKLNYLLQVATKIGGSGIVYVRSRKRTKEFSDFLNRNGVTADYYHAGLDNIVRSNKQEDWKKNKTRVIVSTNAFGMGIDKPDVRFVVHMDVPDSLEAYFQEAGRAGRDEKKAFAVLLYNESDKIQLEEHIPVMFPDVSVIKNIYTSLGNFLQVPVGSGKGHPFDFNIMQFADNYNMPVLTAYNSLKFLEREGYIELTDVLDCSSMLHFKISRDNLYDFQVKNTAFDSFIKLLLRSYAGVFTEYCRIDEQVLAKRAGVPDSTILKYLQKLHDMGVIDYAPKKKTSFIIYTEERLVDKSVIISKENFQDRKKRYISRINAVLDYASSATRCRSQFLLRYFGEDNSYRCGHCDVCQRRNELELSKYEFDLILEKIKADLRQSPLSLHEVIIKSGQKEEKVLKVIEWLLDNNKICYNNEKLLIWVSKKSQ